MKNIWSYVSAILMGTILGIVIGVKWLAGQDISIEVKKIKNKRTSGTTTTNVPIEVEVPKRKRKKRKRDNK